MKGPRYPGVRLTTRPHIVGATGGYLQFEVFSMRQRADEGLPSNELHRVLVSRSYISLLDR